MAECVTHHYACDCREAEHVAEIARLTAQLDAVTVACANCKGGGTKHEFADNRTAAFRCPKCNGTGRVLRCQGRLDAAEDLARAVMLWTTTWAPEYGPGKALRAYDAAVKAEHP